jgi:hypothetical protein
MWKKSKENKGIGYLGKVGKSEQIPEVKSGQLERISRYAQVTNDRI